MVKKFLVLIFSLMIIFSGCSKKVDFDHKVLNLVVSADVKGMDPVNAGDLYSGREIARVYEGLLEYHYLKRPYKLQPNLAESMPTVSKDGLTYTFKIKKGVLFHDDIAFINGKGRELTADDFVYSIKRLADIKNQSTGWWLVDGKLKGLNEWRDKYSDADESNYEDVIEGVKAIDKYTIQFKLTKAYPQFLYALAMPYTFAVAKEVVEKYGKEFLNHPVGTGAFKLPIFTQSNKIVYTRNPTFRKKYFPSEGSEQFSELIKEYGGKQLPFVEKVVVHLLKEDLPRWLNFQKGKIDYISIPKDNFDSAMTPNKDLSKEMLEKGISLDIAPSLDITYMAFNHDMKLFKNKKLRQAMSAAYDVDKANQLLSNGRLIPAQSIVPPGIAGYMKDYKSPYRGPNLKLAKKLMKEAGYPDGKGLEEITYDITSSTVARQSGEFFKQEMAKIGVRVKILQNSWPELMKKVKTRNIMMFGMAWSADYPDAENFLQLLYGPNRSPGPNGGGFNNKIYNKLYETSSMMQDTPERTAIYEKLTRIAAEEAPLIYGGHRQSYFIKNAWIKNYTISDFDMGQEQYLDVDLKIKKKMFEKF